MTEKTDRYKFFESRPGNRYWWFRNNNYSPQIYENLSDFEFEILKEWYKATDEKGMAGESNIPIMSVLLGFIDGSNINTVVQLGHASGWSSLMIGWALKRLGKERALFSMDINTKLTHFAQEWITAAGLMNVVELAIANSTHPASAMKAENYFEDKLIDMIYLDSSHEYEQTKIELNLWWPHIKVGGMIFLHDVGMFAQEYDKTKRGGVHDGLQEWASENLHRQDSIMINRERPPQIVYQDSCGLGILYKNE